ncbi:MAG: hypothetical protein ACI9MF_002777, partial [Gammaproteobacteria bacterium]
NIGNKVEAARGWPEHQKAPLLPNTTCRCCA